MPDLTFEDGTATDAAAFHLGDALHFRQALPLDIAVGYANGAVSLSYGGKSLTFAANSLGEEGEAIDFRRDGISAGRLTLGTARADTLGIYTVSQRAIWTFDGADRVTIAGPGAVAVHAGDGSDRVTVDNAIGADGTLQATGSYLIDGGAGDDQLDLRLATAGLVAWGGGGADLVMGGQGNDHLYGNSAAAQAGESDGADTILGGAGSDYIHGNAGDDSLMGGSGSDRIFGGQGNDVILGEDGNDTVNGNLGNDTIDGGAGNDFLRGGQGDDRILGGDGNDQLFGDIGSDTLIGGAGVDLLTGGAGADVFVFGIGDAVPGVSIVDGFYDTILDYQQGIDRIDLAFNVGEGDYLAGQGVYANVSGAQAYAQQLLDGHAGTTDLAAVAVGSDTYLFFNASGAGASIDSIIKIAAITPAALTAVDFI